MPETVYDDLLRLGQGLLQYQGYLDNAEQQEQRKARTQFDGARNRIVYDLLHRHDDADSAMESLVRDLEAIRRDTPEYLHPVVDFVESELVERMGREGSKSPALRRVVRRAPASALVVALLLYFGVRIYSAGSVDQPIAGRAGIQQHAAAFTKTMRYQEWTDTRRRRWLIELLAWPIAPTDAETKAAVEFAGIVLAGRQADAKLVCDVPAANDQVTEADIALIERAASQALSPATSWLSPSALTLLPPIRSSYPAPSWQ